MCTFTSAWSMGVFESLPDSVGVHPAKITIEPCSFDDSNRAIDKVRYRTLNVQYTRYRIGE
jgi:hypothetical protein